MKYTPSPPPLQVADLRLHIFDELRRIADSMGTEIRLPILRVEPPNAVDGVIVYADGTAWNPGSGAGFYGRQGGAWVKL